MLSRGDWEAEIEASERAVKGMKKAIEINLKLQEWYRKELEKYPEKKKKPTSVG